MYMYVYVSLGGCFFVFFFCLQVSNEIIKRCSAGIPLKEVFDGDEERCRVALKESIHANEAWKRVYSTMVEVAGHASTITKTAAIQLNISSSDHISPNSPQNPPRNTSPSSSSSPAAGPISHTSPSLALPGRTNAGSLNHATAPASLNAAEVVTTGKHRDGTTQEEEQKEERDARHISDWNSKVIFAPVEAFLQRCQDMLEASKSFFYPMPLLSWILDCLEEKLFVLGILNSSQDLKLL